MKEIKFRLRIGNKIMGYEKWYQGERKHFTANSCWLYSVDNKNYSPKHIFHAHKDMFTGLHDKNNVEVFEGDRCGYDYPDTDPDEEFEVIFEDGSYRKKYKRWDKTLAKPILNQHEMNYMNIIVIGNIYEGKS